ncbi:hypothetical protein HY404_02120 [Candidatus Microgenomates bacterium]|nr:hypothetical protein [Candidatus Microgenomates bacterium]
MEPKNFQDAIAQGKNFLILLPKEPDFDTVAAGLSLFLSLNKYGKQTTISCSSPMLVEFNRLVGVDKITTELGSSNLTISLAGYPATNIEKVSYDIDHGEFRLTIVPKADLASPTPEQVRSQMGGMNADVVILVGIINEVQLDQQILEDLNSVSQFITVQATPAFARRGRVIELIDRQTSSICEIMAINILNNNLPLDEDMAANLLMGIVGATANFTSNRVRPETFEVAGKLMRMKGHIKGGVINEQQVATAEENPPEEWLGPKVYKGTALP